MGLFDIFKKKKEEEPKHQEQKDEVQEIAEEYDYDLSSLDITPFAPKKLSKEDKTQTLSYEESKKTLEELSKQEEKKLAEMKKDQAEFYAKVDAAYNLPGQQELNRRVSREADRLLDEVNKSQLFDRVTKFNKKYEDIDVLFSDTRRKFKMVDDNHTLDDTYNQLLELDNYRNIPHEYFKYAYLVKKNQEGLLDNKERSLYDEIKANYAKEDLDSLYNRCILGYAALGYSKMAEDIINTMSSQENKDKILNTIDDIRNEIKNGLENGQNKSR